MKRLLLPSALVIALAFVASTGSATTQATGPCGSATSATYSHVVVVVLENHRYSAIIGKASAPYINSLANECGLATNYFGITHPSLPNYLAMTGGTTAGVTDDKLPSVHPLSNDSIFSQTSGNWQAYEESMPSNCYPKNSSDGMYVARHNPAAYYTNIPCQTQDVPLPSSPTFSAAYTMVNPNMCHVMSRCTITEADTWLSTFIPEVLNSPEYQSGTLALFLTWDEGGGLTGTNKVANIVVAPTVPVGTRSGTLFDHYSMLLTQEQLLGKACLANACSATSMRSAFNL